METPLQRIMEWPLKAEKRTIRGAATGYHVTTISEGMNDREEYAHLFAVAPTLLGTLQSLVEEVAELRRRNVINESRDMRRVDDMLLHARSVIATAIKE